MLQDQESRPSSSTQSSERSIITTSVLDAIGSPIALSLAGGRHRNHGVDQAWRVLLGLVFHLNFYRRSFKQTGLHFLIKLSPHLRLRNSDLLLDPVVGLGLILSDYFFANLLALQLLLPRADIVTLVKIKLFPQLFLRCLLLGNPLVRLGDLLFYLLFTGQSSDD